MGQLRALYDFTDAPGQRTSVSIAQDAVDRPSRVAGDSSTVVSKSSPLTSWKDELSVEEIDRGVALLGELGMGEIYGHDSVPDRAAIDRLRPTCPSPIPVVRLAAN